MLWYNHRATLCTSLKMLTSWLQTCSSWQIKKNLHQLPAKHSLSSELKLKKLHMCEKETFAKLAEKKTWLNFLLKSDVRCAREQGAKKVGLVVCFAWGTNYYNQDGEWLVVLRRGRKKNGGYCNIHKGINFNNSAKRLTRIEEATAIAAAALTDRLATLQSSKLPPAVDRRNKH